MEKGDAPICIAGLDSIFPSHPPEASLLRHNGGARLPILVSIIVSFLPPPGMDNGCRCARYCFQLVNQTRRSGLDRGYPSCPRPSLREGVKVVIKRRRCEGCIHPQVYRYSVLIFVREEVELGGTLGHCSKFGRTSGRRVIRGREGELVRGAQSTRWTRLVVLPIGVKRVFCRASTGARDGVGIHIRFVTGGRVGPADFVVRTFVGADTAADVHQDADNN